MKERVAVDRREEARRDVLWVSSGCARARAQGLEAHKADVMAATSVCNTLRSSIGPR
eukprot:COSAG02_NODE_13083_length_1448_cov_1.670867_2_plen_56_part_01